MKWFKKIVRIFLLLLPCFSFAFVPSVSALKHEVEAIPVFISEYGRPVGGSQPYNNVLDIVFPSDSIPDGISANSMKTPHYFSSSYYSNNNNVDCRYSNYFSSSHIYSQSNGVYIQGKYLSNNTFLNAIPSTATSTGKNPFCNSQYPYDSGVIPPFVTSTFPSWGIANPNPNPSTFLPYSVEYSHIYLKNTNTDTNSGEHYTKRLSLKELLGFETDKIKQFTLNLGPASGSSIGNITEGRAVTFKGVFTFKNGTFSWSQKALSDGYFRIRYEGQEVDSNNMLTNNVYSGTFVCSSNVRTLGSSELLPSGLTQLEYECNWTSPYHFSNDNLYFRLEIGLNNTSSNDWVFRGEDLSWSGLYMVTDNDETPAGPYNSEPFGNYLSNAPGYAHIPSDEQDWFSSLTNLFNFNFINPFSPLFNLFTDNSQCGQIPIIAGMLHAEDTTYCPWFDSTTRNILTPVLGLSSMMLVFGFAVRWLGSSSGNLFEDSKHEELSNVNHSGFRRYKK